MSEEMDKLLDHNYDGIEEFDNPLPNWWVGLFIITTVIGVIYLFMFDLTSIGPSSLDEYAAEYKEYQSTIVVDDEDNEFVEGEEFAALMDAEILSKGEKVYNTNCMSCHGNAGQGGIGPNLTDNYWLHGGSTTEMVWTIVNGVPEKGMISWKPILKKSDIVAVASYIKVKLVGTIPEGAKDPEGELYEEKEELDNEPEASDQASL